MLTAEQLFNDDYYLRQNPDVVALIARGEFANGLAHYLQVGQFQGRNPSPLFDDAFYRSTYGDVDQAIASGGIKSALEHFLQFGQFEGRNPIALFDTPYYLAQNPDVANIVTRNELTAYEHYVRFGRFEPNRNPSANFNTQAYLNLNTDVANLVSTGVITPIEHYLQFGRVEGRLALPPGPSQLLSGAIDLGNLSEPRTVTDTVSTNNPTDIYRFVLGNPSTLNLSLTDLSDDADLELIQDVNRNGLIDNAEDILAYSVNFGTDNDAIQAASSPPGTYWARVSLSEVPGTLGFGPLPTNANYKLTVSA